VTVSAGAAAMSWRRRDAHTWAMDLDERGEEWIEVKRLDGAQATRWKVDSRLCGSHYKMSEAFETLEAAQGGALLLAMRLLPSRRRTLHAALDEVPDAWWWKIAPGDDDDAEHRAVISRRTEATPEAAEHGGRAAGAGWWLFVFGPGCVRAFGRLPR
jgi:hypothetical protein